jgi:hypothetical protein
MSNELCPSWPGRHTWNHLFPIHVESRSCIDVFDVTSVRPLALILYRPGSRDTSDGRPCVNTYRTSSVRDSKSSLVKT